jgi:threonyl-tRNA synthetase
MASVFGLKMGENYSYRLSLGDRDNKKKYFDDDKSWDQAEEVLRSVLVERRANFVEAKDEAAFYGPKIDIQMKKVNGVEETAFTVQYDFVMPGRFNLVYTDSEGKEKLAMVVHRSSIGAIERIAAFLLEHFNGALPLWLSPVQVAILPVSDKQMEYASEIKKQLAEKNIRVEIAKEGESLGKKIMEAQKMKIPYMLVVGNKEIEYKTVTVRRRGNDEQKVMTVEELSSELLASISSKSLT